LSDLAERIQTDLVSAMKAGEKHRVETLRGLNSDLKYRRIAEGRDLVDRDVLDTLRQAAKRRREAVEAYDTGGRKDLSDKEKAELEMISAYLPADMSDVQLDQIIKDALAETGAKDPSEMGQVMKHVMPKVDGQAPGDRVRARVQALLTSET
jgi:uncharacterized protein YqeY